jgi:glycerol-3-phosphate dehydrogenase
MNFSSLLSSYDLVVAGGGITGAGVFHEAVLRGYRALLVEASDFAWGTSSRSSKMVHGGLRYLKQGKFRLTKAAVKEREALLEEYAGLVTPLHFMMPLYDKWGPSLNAMKLGLSLYSYMAGNKQHCVYTRDQVKARIPFLRSKGLVSAVGFKDAQVDDARLVQRLIDDACRMGGEALNYTRLESVHRDQKGKVAAVTVTDVSTGEAVEVQTRVLINATGPFAESLHPSPVKGCHIRKLRGSHLVFPAQKCPTDSVISFAHPEDLRPVFLFPWEGRLVLGTTDVDHDQDMSEEPRISVQEAQYLMRGVQQVLPGLELTSRDCIASIAGVRPVLSRKNRPASKESREHVVWKKKGLITVTGGKLTTFRLLANDALKAARPWLASPKKQAKRPIRMTDPVTVRPGDKTAYQQKRLQGRYGMAAVQMPSQYDNALFEPIAPTHSLWVELCHNAKEGRIRHLSDLMLRRLRIGLLLDQGGSGILDRVQEICTPYLDWDSHKWEQEKKAYRTLWQRYYSPPGIF